MNKTNDNATLSFVLLARQARRFLPISIAKSAAMIHRAFDDSAAQILSAPLRHACRCRFDRADGNGAGFAIQFATLATGLALTSADFIVF